MGELMSVLDLLRSTKGVDEPLRILCDSQYAINCCTRWIPAWKKRGWRKADNKPVLNLDLLKQLDEELAGRQVTFQWVRGHTGHPLNEMADTLARAAATAYQQGTPVPSGPGFSKAPLADPAPAADNPGEADPAADETPVQPAALVPLPPDPLEDRQPDLLSIPYIVRKPPRDQPDTPLVVDVTGLTREFLSDETQLDRERLDELMHPDYVAHLPEGLIRTKGSILARPAALGGTIQLDILGADRLTDTVILLRYRLKRNSQDFLGAILWQADGPTWRARFQQLTPVA